MPSRKVHKIAGEICTLYFAAIRSEVVKVSRSGGNITAKTIDEVDDTTRGAFRAAARACIELEADAREYIVAQFSAWRSAGSYYKKLMWPSPSQLGSDGARIRYVMFKANESTRLSRAMTIEVQDNKRRWFVEERKLKGMARVQQRDPIDVMAEHPEEFSRDFLKHKNVWDVVGDLWQERQ